LDKSRSTFLAVGQSISSRFVAITYSFTRRHRLKCLGAVYSRCGFFVALCLIQQRKTPPSSDQHSPVAYICLQDVRIDDGCASTASNTLRLSTSSDDKMVLQTSTAVSMQAWISDLRVHARANVSPSLDSVLIQS
jgi:hypothetical protein